MRASIKYAAGCGSLLPSAMVLGIAIYCVVQIILFEKASTGTLGDPFGAIAAGALSPMELAVLGFLVVGLALFQLAMLVGFVVHAWRRKVPGGLVAIWGIAFYLMPYVALPLYWLLYMLNDRGTPPDQQAQA